MPRLVHFEEADYPEVASRARRSGTVVLKLAIDSEGRVTAAGVHKPAGYGFDAAAATAALRFRFEPALRNGKPVASIILYKYEFQAGPSPEAKAPLPLRSPPRGRSGGPSLGAGTRAPLGVPSSARSEGTRNASLANSRPGLSSSGGPESAPATQVLVRGRSIAQSLARSGQAVDVVGLASERSQGADLGEVLARAPGVSVRRVGGLGGAARFSLAGLGDDRVAFFLDGIPLKLAGHALGPANVPVHLLERVEIYRGVVPVRFGADALGGAVNLVSDRSTRGTRVTNSVQAGSFGERRWSGSVRHLQGEHVFLGASGFVDGADNDYSVEVDIAGPDGRVSRAEVVRPADDYAARGLSVEAGLVRLPGVSRLLARGYFGQNRRQVRHNALMTVAYGEVGYRKHTRGLNLEFQSGLEGAWSFNATLGVGLERTDFTDLARCRYGFTGECLAPLPQRGEVTPDAREQRVDETTGFGFAHAAYQPSSELAVRLSVAPRRVHRDGRDRTHEPGEYDPLRARRRLLGTTSGVELETQFGSGGRLRNIAFGKHYWQQASTLEQLPNATQRQFKETTSRWGVGDSLRLTLAQAFYVRASYELATRLPTPAQIFGDGVLIVENLEVEAEQSHNANLDLVAESWHTPVGTLSGSLAAFGRFAKRMLVLIGGTTYQQYGNVGSARALGAQLSLDWETPLTGLSLSGSATRQRVTNTARSGPYAAYEGDSVPHQPQAQGYASAVWQRADAVRRGDQLRVNLSARHVRPFLRGWASLGREDSKLSIPAQTLIGAGASYRINLPGVTLTTSLDALNLMNALAYDFYGSQRPGRAFYITLTSENRRTGYGT